MFGTWTSRRRTCTTTAVSPRWRALSQRDMQRGQVQRARISLRRDLVPEHARLRLLEPLGIVPVMAMALQHAKRPDFVGTVLAGADVDATARAREAFAPYAPSSPSVGLLRDGKLIYMLERRQIEMRDARAIAAMLTAAFDEHC